MATTSKYDAVIKALTALHTAIASETKADPRLRRALKRVRFLQGKAAVAKAKYELIMSRKVPAKVKARKAGAKKTAAKKSADIVQLHAKKTAAASRAKHAVKRSK
jgi:hypothetical protein